MMKYQDFIKKYKNKEIKIEIDKKVAIQLMDRRNNIVELMPKKVQKSHRFWVSFFNILFATGIVGSILSMIIGFAQWYFFLGFVFVSLYGSKNRVVNDAVESIKNEITKNEKYYNYLISLEKQHNQKYLIIK